MAKEVWTLREVLELFQIGEELLSSLEEERIIVATCREDPPIKLFPASEVEKLRLVKILVDEMDVNLAGVEVILQMRQNMIAMRNQFDAILEDLARQLEKAMKNVS